MIITRYRFHRRWYQEFFLVIMCYLKMISGIMQRYPPVKQGI